MDFDVRVVIAPTQEPITEADVAAYVGLPAATSADLRLFGSLLRAARLEAETYLGRAILTQTLELKLSEWPDAGESLALPYAASNAAIVGVWYYDANGTEQSLDSSYYTLDAGVTPAEVSRALSMIWPALQPNGRRFPIRIRYTAGAATPETVDPRLVGALLSTVAAREADRAGAAAAGIAEAFERMLDAIGSVAIKGDPCRCS